MRDVSLWLDVLGVEKTVIERLEFDEDADLLVAHVRPTSRARSRCSVCARRSPGYDAGEGLLRAPVKSDRYDVDELGKSEDVITVARTEVEAVGVGCAAINRSANRRDVGGTGAGDCLDGC